VKRGRGVPPQVAKKKNLRRRGGGRHPRVRGKGGKEERGRELIKAGPGLPQEGGGIFPKPLKKTTRRSRQAPWKKPRGDLLYFVQFRRPDSGRHLKEKRSDRKGKVGPRFERGEGGKVFIENQRQKKYYQVQKNKDKVKGKMI